MQEEIITLGSQLNIKHMKRIFTIIVFAFIGLFAFGQVDADFENFQLNTGEYLNGSDGQGVFYSGYLYLPNDYNESYSSWTGWAISATTDIETEGFTNQYSSITGGGVDGSNTYAVSYNFVPNEVDFYNPGPGSVITHKGVYITNSTYAYLSMLNGDSFAKKFGGVDGTEPDYNLLTIRGLNTDGQQDSVEFYLADFRSDNTAEDYIVDEWTFVDLSKFLYGPELTFGLTTTDVGVYGANTPAFFCIDNFEFDVVSSTEDESFSDLKVFPNPAYDVLNIKFEDAVKFRIINSKGQVVLSESTSTNQIDISILTSGIYNLIVSTEKGEATRRFIKL